MSMNEPVDKDSYSHINSSVFPQLETYHHQSSNFWKYLRFPSTSISLYHSTDTNHHFIMPTLTAECLHSNAPSLERSGFSNNSNTGLGLLLADPLLTQRRDDLESSCSTESLKSTSPNGQLPCRELEGCYLDLQLGNYGRYIGSWSPFESCTTFPNRVSHNFIPPPRRCIT
jgi:hypothetical protein